MCFAIVVREADVDMLNQPVALHERCFQALHAPQKYICCSAVSLKREDASGDSAEDLVWPFTLTHARFC